MKEETRTETLVEEGNALSLYFEALLRVEEEPVEAEAPVETPATDEPAAVAPRQTGAAIPCWGEGSFQALLFKAGGLTLAVPLVELAGIQEWQAEAVTPMPDHVEWYLGLVDYRGRSVPVVDTALLVLPEERRAQLTMSPSARLKRVVFIGEGEWGLACDQVTQVVTLAPDKIRWRSSRTRRQWLAGTVIDHMCAIIDPPAFAKMLATGVEDAEVTPAGEPTDG